MYTANARPRLGGKRVRGMVDTRSTGPVDGIMLFGAGISKPSMTGRVYLLQLPIKQPWRHFATQLVVFGDVVEFHEVDLIEVHPL